MKRRKYKRKDPSKMTPEELKKYKKTLASVRAYTKDKREWQKAMTAGQTTHRTLQAYRDAKYGRVESIKTEQAVMKAIDHGIPLHLGSNDLLEKLRRLIATLEKVENDKVLILKQIETDRVKVLDELRNAM